MAVKLVKKITGVALKDLSSQTPVVEVVKSEDDPVTKRIDKRPKGRFNSVTEKLEYSTVEGKKKVYLTVSFMPVSGVLDGKDVVIERPIEFFFHNGLDQWISAAMRGLSLAARGGFLAEQLQDMRNVEWTKGQVRCGAKDYGNGKVVPIMHNSEVAAIAWAIQDILHERGYLDVDGNQIPARVLCREKEMSTEDVLVESIQHEDVSNVTPIAKGLECPSCHSHSLVNSGGCNICTECGYSKC